MEKEYSVPKLYSIANMLLVISYVCILVSSNTLRTLDYASLELVDLLIYLVLAWLPLIILMSLCALYSLVMISNNYLSISKYCYLSMIVFSIAVGLVFIPQEWFSRLNIHLVNSGIILFAMSNILINHIIQIKLVSLNFSFSYELAMLKAIYEEAKKTKKQKWSDLLGRFVFLFTIPFIISASNEVFITVVAIMAIIGVYPLHRLVEAYCEIREYVGINPKWLYVNYVLSVGISIPLYVFCLFKLPAFICLFSCFFLKYIFNSKYGRYLYAEIEGY